jgi:hypothetical protein
MKKFNTKVGQVFIINSINNTTPSGSIGMITTAVIPPLLLFQQLLETHFFLIPAVWQLLDIFFMNK